MFLIISYPSVKSLDFTNAKCHLTPEIRMLHASESGDMRKFKKYSEFVYGKPSEDIFGYTVNSIRSEATLNLASDDETIQAAARELLEILPSELPHHEISLIPNDEAIASMRQATLESAGDLIELPEGTTFDASSIKTTFDSALETLKADGWQVVIDTSSKSGISVDQEKQQVKIPEGRTLTPNKLQTLIVHEIGTHVKRRVTGERSKLKLLGLGLDRYETGEEGVATAREQAMSGKVDDFAGLDGHLAIGLAYGLDGTPRNFREVYEVLKKYYKLTSLVGKEAKETVEDKSSDKAWNRCVRTFRGSDSKTKGACFTKDIVYREGNIGTWNVIRNNPQEMARFDVGKYDPSNPRHIWILETLGIEDAEIV